MRKFRFGTLILTAVLLLGTCTSGFATTEEIKTEEVVEVTEISELTDLRNDDFEDYVPGYIFNGSAFCPVEGDNAGKGVVTEDGSLWFRDENEGIKGGFTTAISSGMTSALISVPDKDGNMTKVVQILRPKKVAPKQTDFLLHPAASLNTARLLYEVDVRNGGSAGEEGEPGFTNSVNNYFGSLSILGITFDFNKKTVTLPSRSDARPAVLAQDFKWAVPDNGQWFHILIDLDVLTGNLYVFINDKEVASANYRGAFTSISNDELAIKFATSKDGENVIYLDNIRIQKSNLSAEELARKTVDEEFRMLGANAYLMYNGSAKVYYGDKIDRFNPDSAMVAPEERDGTVYIPLRYVAENEGYEVIWDGETKCISLVGDKEIVLPCSGNTLSIDGVEKTLQGQVGNFSGTTKLSVEDIAMLFDKKFYKDTTGLTILMEDDSGFPEGQRANCIASLIGLYPEASLGFETKDGWYSMADLLEASGQTADKLSISFRGSRSDINNSTYESERHDGIVRSTEFVKSGHYSGKWDRHHYYPTIMAADVPKDWTPYNMLSFWVYSEKATNERITVGAVSNVDRVWENNETQTNFFYFGITIDFTGWKKFELPLEMWEKSSEFVHGFDKIEGLYFYSRALNCEPSPYTVLYLDDIKLETVDEAYKSSIVEQWQAIRSARDEKMNAELSYVVDVPDVFKDINLPDYCKLLENKKIIESGNGDVAAAKENLKKILKKYGIEEENYSYSDLTITTTSTIAIDGRSLNPNVLEETLRYNHDDPELVKQITPGKPIESQAYFKHARAIYGYDPKYYPGPVGDTGEHKFIWSGSRIFQVVDDEGKWHFYDLSMQIQKYCEEELQLSNISLRADGFYDETKIRFDNDGDAYILLLINGYNQAGKKIHTTVLGHSRDKLKTWDFYKLSRAFGKMEVLDGNNQDCLERPPVIVLHNYFTSTDKDGAFIIPEKKEDGTLFIPEEIIYADGPIISVSQHSGKANFCVTYNGKVYFTYGYLESNQQKRLSLIPQDSVIWSQNPPNFSPTAGVLTYIISYDLKTKELSEPVFLGCAGKHGADEHNWSAISVDSEGYLHALLIGHHATLVYMKSKQPENITEWELPEYVSSGISYASLNIDKNDTVYCVTRNSNRDYIFDIALQRRTKDGKWTESRIFQFWKQYYAIWGHDVFMTADGTLYVHFIGKSYSYELFADDFAAHSFYFPESSRVTDDRRPSGTRVSGMYASGGAKVAGEGTLVMSKDGGKSWQLVTTEEFMSK